MSKLDEQKEYIGILKVYLGFILAIIISVGSGISKLYLDDKIGLLFWLGIITIISAILVFIFIADIIHKHIKKLKDL